MKMITAFIRHEAFEPIRADLLAAGLPSLSVTEVKGSGRQKGVTETYRGSAVVTYLRPKLKLECAVADADVNTVVETLLRHARTGQIGDGKIFVSSIEQVYRIRTGEAGAQTLQSHVAGEEFAA